MPADLPEEFPGQHEALKWLSAFIPRVAETLYDLRRATQKNGNSEPASWSSLTARERKHWTQLAWASLKSLEVDVAHLQNQIVELLNRQEEIDSLFGKEIGGSEEVPVEVVDSKTVLRRCIAMIDGLRKDRDYWRGRYEKVQTKNRTTTPKQRQVEQAVAFTEQGEA